MNVASKAVFSKPADEIFPDHVLVFPTKSWIWIRLSFTVKKVTCDARGARTACSSCILQLMKLEQSSSRSRSLEYDRSFYNCRLDNENLPNVFFCFFFPHVLLPFGKIKTCLQNSQYTLFTFISNYYNYIYELLLFKSKCHLYNNHLAWNFFCVLFLTAMYFSVIYLTSTCFKKTSHSGILSCFRLCHICNFARTIR